MALARADKVAGGNTATLTTYLTASFTTVTGELLIAFFQSSLTAGGIPGAHAISGGTLGGVTWTLIGSTLWNSSTQERITAWRGEVTTGGTGTLGFTPAEATSQGAAWSVFSYTGHDTAGPVSAAVTGIDTDAAFGPLNVSALTGAVTVWGVARNTNATEGAHTGASIIQNASYTAPARNLVTLEEAGENNPGVTWSAVFAAGGIAFKVREAGGGGGGGGAGTTVAVGGVKKATVAESVVIGGVKKAVVAKWVIVGGVKKVV